MELTKVLFVAALIQSVAVAETLWPKPKSVTTYSDQYTLHPSSFKWTVEGYNSHIIQDAIKRYIPLVFFKGPPQSAPGFGEKISVSKRQSNVLEGIDINVQSSDDTLGPNTNESYVLNVQIPRAQLIAPTVYGALRGLETFSQLVDTNGDGTYTMKKTSIVDEPRFGFRGIMIDTSRHWLPLSVIYQHIDAMAYNKFNVLHWHIVDSQSFPYQSAVYPLLSTKGAWWPDHIYTKEDIISVINFAKMRGIRVIPEFDTPGHTLSWGNGYPELLTDCYKDGKVYGKGPFQAIDPYVLSFMTDLLKEVGSVFPDEYMHIGGDEVSFDCWQSNPDDQRWMKEHNYTDYNQIEQYYETNLLSIMQKIGKEYIVWQEIFDNGLKVKPDTVIDVWKGGWNDTMAKVTKAGLRAILSNCWYLNYISYGADWTKYYACDPQEFDGTNQQKQLVIGGEACMWGEFVDTTNLIPRMWPRASAVGERLWSPQDTKDVNDASVRLNDMRCRLVRRNIPAEPADGPGFCKQEYNYVYNSPY